MKTSSRNSRAWAATTAVVLASAMVLAGCGSSESPSGEKDSALSGGVTFDAPSGPGSGYDQTARALAQSLKDGDFATRVDVKNTEGAGGTIALSQFMQKSGTKDLMIGGLSLVGATITNKAPNKLGDLTPVARLIGEYETIVVPADSSFETLKDLLDALKTDPGKVPIAIGNQGGVDHMWGGTLVKEAGVEPTDANFVTFSGGGEALVALLGGQVAAGISGYAEFADQIEAGKLRVLAVSSDKPLEIAPDAPTITDAGYPDAVLVNWRGVFAPAGIDESDRKALSDVFAELNDSASWKKARETNGWSDEYLDSDAFSSQLEKEQVATEQTLKELGLA